MMAASLAEYLDSTPELRARRDAMLAMCDEFEERRRHPWRRMADPQGIVHIRQRCNTMTGEWLQLDPPAEIHHDDLEWLSALWDESDRIDYEIWRAGCSTG